MSDPPFPVPAGMVWDRDKKRFFKKPPQEAKIRHKSKYKVNSEEDRDSANLASSISKSIWRQHHLAQPTSVSFASTNYASSQASKRAFIRSSFSSLKHVATTSLIPWSLQGHVTHSSQCDAKWKSICIKSIHQMEGYPSLLVLQDGLGTQALIDTPHIHRFEPSSAITLRLRATEVVGSTSLEYARHQGHDEFVRTESDRNIRETFDHNRLLDIDDGYIVITHLGVVAVTETLAEGVDFNTFTGLRFREVMTFESMNAIDHLRLHACKKNKGDKYQRLLVMYSTERQVGLFEIYWPLKSMDVSVEYEGAKRGAFFKTRSDVICIEIFRDASSILIGLRNGKVMQCDVEDFLLDMIKSEDSLGAHLRSFKDQQLPYNKSAARIVSEYIGGAVTHIEAVSNEEVIIAFSDGTVHLRLVCDLMRPLVSYIGHINSWSLDLPMTVDRNNRLLAMAGQDRKIRLWHLDDPYPLRGVFGRIATDDEKPVAFDIANSVLSDKTVQEMTFSAPISGLTFCTQRKIIEQTARLEEYNGEGSLPGLAVATSGPEIAFFE